MNTELFCTCITATLPINCATMRSLLKSCVLFFTFFKLNLSDMSQRQSAQKTCNIVLLTMLEEIHSPIKQFIVPNEKKKGIKPG